MIYKDILKRRKTNVHSMRTGKKLQNKRNGTFIIYLFRRPSHPQWSDLWVLSWAVSWHHLHDKDSAENSLLFFQPDSSLRAHCLHGCSWVHSSSRLRREAVFRWDTIYHFFVSSGTYLFESLIKLCWIFKMKRKET